MKTFREIVKQWNGGIERGAQTRLAKQLGVKPNTVSQWVNGTLAPGEVVRPKLAKILGISLETLEQLLTPHYKATARDELIRDAGTSYAAPSQETLNKILARLDDMDRRLAAVERGALRHGRKPVEGGGQ